MVHVLNEPKTSLDVMLQDQTTEIIDLYMLDLDNAVPLTVAEAQDIDERSITVEDATGVLADGTHGINISQDGRVFQAVVTDVTDDVISFNAPLDMAVGTSAVVKAGLWNMTVDGSTTSRLFKVTPPPNVKWDITRILIAMEATASMDDSKFGSLDALTNGVVLRAVDGFTKNIFVVTTNGGLAERMYDVDYPTKVPAGIYALRARRTFGGQDKNGVVVRLDGDTGDSLEFIISDDLSGGTLTKFVCVAQGHVVE